MKPKQLLFKGVRLVTDEDLIFVSEEGTITVVAAKVENGKTLSIVRETFTDGHLEFLDVAFDEHGTIEAVLRLLHRCFRWEKIAQTARFGTPIFKMKAKRTEDFYVFLLANWQTWNEKGFTWDERHFEAQESDFGFGIMPLDTFQRRCERMGLKFLAVRNKTAA